MKGGHLLQSSPVQQQMMVAAAAAGNPTNWPWSTSTTIRPPPPPNSSHQTLPNFFIFPPTLSSSSSPLPFPSWLDTQDHHPLPPESWSQLLLGGLVVGDEDKGSQMMMMNQLQQGINNKFDNHIINGVKQESSPGSFVSCYDANQAPVNNWPHHQIIANTSNTTTTNNNNSPEDVGLRHPPPPLPTDPSPESNSMNTSSGGGIAKKARVQPSSSSTSTQSALKVVRKEKVGDRITTLHQIVSPFGKTDTASVLLEAIGYIRFLQSQIQALSLPYLGSGSSSLMHQHDHQHHYQHSVQGERNCVFPEHPGQECYNDDEAKKDLRSRGLCLVPVSCTMQVGNENGADYWAPSLGGGFR
ncbi:Transcription factor bHLH68 [Linum grandiflorum]